jgi:hypothetical protein
MQQNDEYRLDELLDKALATYTSQGPPLGLEARVLRRIQAGNIRRGWPVRRWVLVAAACCLLGGIDVWIRRATFPAPGLAPARIVLSNVTPQPTAPDMEDSKPLAGSIQRTRKRLPRHSLFPAPAALTHQERALMAFVNNATEQALQTFGPMQPIQIEPLNIDKIDVQPLPDRQADAQ